MQVTVLPFANVKLIRIKYADDLELKAILDALQVIPGDVNVNVYRR